MGRNLAILSIPFDVLHRALGLPEGVRIDDVRASSNSLDLVDIRLEGECLPHVPSGYVIPGVRAEVHEGEASARLYAGAQRLTP